MHRSAGGGVAHGRQAALKVTRTLLQRAQRGLGGVALVQGEPGVGKSLLLGERRDRIAAGVDVNQDPAVARHDDGMPGIQGPAGAAGGIRACRGQRPVGGAAVRLDRVAGGRVGHGVHRPRSALPAARLRLACQGHQPAGRGQPDRPGQDRAAQA
jgi:hypothetical protein